MAFEEFKAVRGKFTPQVTINKGGGFGMTAGMHHRYKLDDYSGVKLYFDKDSKKIGIKVLKEIGEGVFKLKKRPNEKGAYFSAKSFLQAYGIDQTKCNGRYTPEEVNDPQFGEMFVIDLSSKM